MHAACAVAYCSACESTSAQPFRHVWPPTRAPGPDPQMATRSPRPTSPISQPCHAVGRMSDSSMTWGGGEEQRQVEGAGRNDRCSAAAGQVGSRMACACVPEEQRRPEEGAV